MSLVSDQKSLFAVTDGTKNLAIFFLWHFDFDLNEFAPQGLIIIGSSIGVVVISGPPVAVDVDVQVFAFGLGELVTGRESPLLVQLLKSGHNSALQNSLLIKINKVSFLHGPYHY